MEDLVTYRVRIGTFFGVAGLPSKLKKSTDIVRKLRRRRGLTTDLHLKLFVLLGFVFLFVCVCVSSYSVPAGYSGQNDTPVITSATRGIGFVGRMLCYHNPPCPALSYRTSTTKVGCGHLDQIMIMDKTVWSQFRANLTNPDSSLLHVAIMFRFTHMESTPELKEIRITYFEHSPRYTATARPVTCDFLLGNKGSHSYNGNPRSESKENIEDEISSESNRDKETTMKLLHHKLKTRLITFLPDFFLERISYGVKYVYNLDLQYFSNVYDMFEYLEKNGIIQCGRYDNLKSILSASLLPEACQVVEEYSTKMAPFLKDIPAYIRSLSSEDMDIYYNSLEDGKETYRHIRVTLVGHKGIGKTTLCKFLTETEINLGNEESTNGANILIHPFEVFLSTKHWNALKDKEENFVKRIANVIASKDKYTRVVFSNDYSLTDTCTDRIRIRYVLNGKALVTEDVDSKEVIYERMPTESLPSGNSKRRKIQNENRTTVQRKYIDHKEKEYLEFQYSVLQASKQGKQELANISIWDFAGDDDFYSTHHVFLSSDSVYVVLCNAKKCLEGTEEEKVLAHDELVYWLRSIKTYANTGEKQKTNCPPVILVGSHADQLQLDSKEDEFLNFALGLLDRPEMKGIEILWCTVVDYSTSTDEKLEELRGMIVEAAEYQDQWGKRIPAKWISLELLIMKEKERGTKVLSFDKIKELNEQIETPLKEEGEIEIFLRYLHASRVVIYFDEDGMSSKDVIIDLQWLIDAFRCLVTKECFVPKTNLTLRSLWTRFRATAKLNDGLISCAWRPDFIKYKETLLDFMIKFGLISLPLTFENKEHKDSFFIVPSVLKSLDVGVLNRMTSGLTKDTCSLYLDFDAKFVPMEIYDRLIASCVSKMEPFKKLEDCVYRSTGIFKIDSVWSLLIYCHQSFISLTLYRSGETEYLAGDKVRKEIEMMLWQVLKLNRQETVQYSYGFNCSFHVENLGELINLEDIKSNKNVRCCIHRSTKDEHYITLQDIQFWGFEINTDETDNTTVSTEVKSLHSKMVAEISGSLSPELNNWISFKGLLKPYLNDVEIAETISVGIACDKLLQKHKLKFGDYEVLLDILHTMEMKVMCDVVNKYSTKIKEQLKLEMKQKQ